MPCTRQPQGCNGRLYNVLLMPQRQGVCLPLCRHKGLLPCSPLRFPDVLQPPLLQGRLPLADCRLIWGLAAASLSFSLKEKGMTKRIGFIGGSIQNFASLFEPEKSKLVKTQWGKPSSPLCFLRFKDIDVEVVHLARHGAGHSLPPHSINNRANIQALADAGCSAILVSSACGSLREDLVPGTMVVPDQFIDFTRRTTTFFDEFKDGDIRHTVMADPFDPRLRESLLKGAQSCGLKAHDGGTVISITGPRFSTRAESRMFRIWGADIINMTVAPECLLANEIGIPYAAIALVTDYDCWSADHPPLDFEGISRIMEVNGAEVEKTLLAAFASLA